MGARNTGSVKYISSFFASTGTFLSRRWMSITFRKIWASFRAEKKREYSKRERIYFFSCYLYIYVYMFFFVFTNSFADFHTIVIFMLPRVGVKLPGIFRQGTSGENKWVVCTTLRIYNQQTVENETGATKCWNHLRDPCKISKTNAILNALRARQQVSRLPKNASALTVFSWKLKNASHANVLVLPFFSTETLSIMSLPSSSVSNQSIRFQSGRTSTPLCKIALITALSTLRIDVSFYNNISLTANTRKRRIPFRQWI